MVRYGVGLERSLEAIHTTVALASRLGVSQARIALQPEELGDIRIHLSQSSNGLVARITADTPAAAQALADGRSELHQSLSSLGTNIVRIELGLSSQAEARGEQRSTNGSSGEHGSQQGEGKLDLSDPGMSEEQISSQEPIELTGGALVDVLA